MKKNIIFISLILFSTLSFSQGVGINTSGIAPHASAILDASSTTQGFLPPRMTTAQRNAILNPAVGLMIFNTDNNCMEYARPSGWYSMCPKLATLTTASVSNITGTSAVSGGNITDDGGATVTARGICWSTNANPTTADFVALSGIGIGIFTNSMASLTNGTPYYVRAFATNSVGTAYGDEIIFTTLNKPTINTVAAANVYGKNASIGGQVISDGGAAITSKGICWSTQPNPGLSDSTIVSGNGSSSFTSIIGGLNYSTTYYARSFATNSVGTTLGNVVSFTTTTGVLVSFTNTGTSSWTLPTGVRSAEVLIVAGGGGGGCFGGGGGGGGLVYRNNYYFSQSNIQLTVGNGGLGSSAYNIANSPGANGENSVLDGITAIGGGGGGTRGPFPHPGFPGMNGGSGGGGSPGDQGSYGTGGDADYIVPRQGYDGGSEISFGWGGSGGGGAGGVGIGGNGNIGGNGGPGLANAITGSSVFYAGGGGGCSYNSSPVGQGGIGGGGAGTINGNGVSGASNTGGGGGGSGVAAVGGNGGSGVIHLRY